MPKILTVLLLIASFSPAQTPALATMTPFGPWGLCGHEIPATSWMCIGSEQQAGNYQLTIKGSSGLAAAYRYTVYATMMDGSPKTVIGVANRDDNQAGYTTIQPVAFGGKVASWQIRIDELAVIASVQNARTTR